MSKTLPVPADTQLSEPSVVLFGRDEAGKPHASWFDGASANLAVKAADLMNMRVLKVETEEHKALARQLARGRVFATGRAFTPFARASLYNKLVELTGGASGLTAVQANTEGAADLAHRPADFSVDGVQALAAMLAEPNGAAAGPVKASEPAALPPAPTSTISPRPEDWDEIGIGSLVLATVGVEDGWWESVVLGVNGEMFTLKWRDFPRERTFVRRRTELALLPVKRPLDLAETAPGLAHRPRCLFPSPEQHDMAQRLPLRGAGSCVLRQAQVIR
jgi:hypothetical protein